ncbi:MAG: sigma-70 family RNA polymerase sigma factor [Candidatus Brocadiia bacterium]
MDNRPDEQLTAAYVSGEQPAFDHLVHRWQPRLFGFACRKLSCIELFVPDTKRGESKINSDADEVSESTIVSTWKNIRRFNDTRKFSSWIYKICKDECYMFTRSEARRNKHCVPLPEDIDKLRYGKVREYAEAKITMDCILAILNHRQHRLFDLIVEDGRHYEAILQEDELFRANNEPELRDEFAVLMEMLWLKRQKEIDNLHKHDTEFRDISLRYHADGPHIKKDN